MFAAIFVVSLLSVASVIGHPIQKAPRDLKIVGLTNSRRATAPELELLKAGNQAFRESTTVATPALLKDLTDQGQAPPFMFLGCSDSRVSEGTIFNAKPGTLFTSRNIANQFFESDVATTSVLAYGVSELGVKHVIIVGHYGCGGVAASIATRPTGNVDAAGGLIQNWINPIRELYETSSRPEIVELREKNKAIAVVEEPEPREPGFRALVEENIKAGVSRMASSTTIINHYAKIAAAGNNTSTEGAEERRSGEEGAAGDVFIHGWVYDIENGEIKDLGVSVGPPGKEIPTAPFEAVAKAAESAIAAHGTEEAPIKEESSKETLNLVHMTSRCGPLCKAKRAIHSYMS